MNDLVDVHFTVSNAIDLEPNIVLPSGTYPGQLSFMRMTLRGRRMRQLGRANLYLTRDQLAAMGVDVSRSSALGIGADIVRFVKSGEIGCVEYPDAGQNLAT